MSTAVLYLDLTSAFHHLIREFVLGISNEDDFIGIIAELQAAGHPVAAFERGQQLIGALRRNISLSLSIYLSIFL